ncbi:50S ribosomal protein L25/general stress protein Ctc [Solidesulfovibrio sp.]|uniref:50S ribosomal protein L25/general stress protein Ctc n=1 Tax=Solidesulfovibrio sp. TaxID=2910990 RepID=UPI00260AC047|nr:50S ribosomal protein L25/general stress protein Ctc [Solidesulfovibrio sp.]
MKEMQTLTVSPRTGIGKGANRKLRAKDLVPGVYYDAAGVNIPVMVEHLPLEKLYSKTSSAHVFHLEIEGETGKETKPALVWKLQYHPTKARFTHVDFYGVDLEKPIRVHIPVEVVGKSKGQVKGGALELHRESIEVSSLPLSIPDKVVIDITELDVNESVQVADLTLPEGVTAVYDDNYAILGIIMPEVEAAAPSA